jgi:hypothetical protein
MCTDFPVAFRPAPSDTAHPSGAHGFPGLPPRPPAALHSRIHRARAAGLLWRPSRAHRFPGHLSLRVQLPWLPHAALCAPAALGPPSAACRSCSFPGGPNSRLPPRPATWDLSKHSAPSRRSPAFTSAPTSRSPPARAVGPPRPTLGSAAHARRRSSSIANAPTTRSSRPYAHTPTAAGRPVAASARPASRTEQGLRPTGRSSRGREGWARGPGDSRCRRRDGRRSGEGMVEREIL